MTVARPVQWTPGGMLRQGLRIGGAVDALLVHLAAVRNCLRRKHDACAIRRPQRTGRPRQLRCQWPLRTAAAEVEYPDIARGSRRIVPADRYMATVRRQRRLGVAARGANPSVRS